MIAKNWKQSKCLQNGILSNKREHILDMYNNADEVQKHDAKPDAKGCLLCVALSVTLWRRQSCRQGNRRSPVVGRRLTTSWQLVAVTEITHVLAVLVVIGLCMVVIVYKFYLNKHALRQL